MRTRLCLDKKGSTPNPCEAKVPSRVGAHPTAHAIVMDFNMRGVDHQPFGFGIINQTIR